MFADSHGKVTSFSLDKYVPTGNFSGPTGSILSIDVLKSYGKNGMLACVGLDRFLRLYDLSSRACLGNVYCKTKMTSVLIIDGTFTTEAPEKVSSIKRKASVESFTVKSGDHEHDKLWSQIFKVENSGDSGGKRRRLNGRSKEE